MEVGRRCVHRPSRGRAGPRFTDQHYQLLSSAGVTMYNHASIQENVFSLRVHHTLFFSRANLTNACTETFCLTHAVQV